VSRDGQFLAATLGVGKGLRVRQRTGAAAVGRADQRQQIEGHEHQLRLVRVGRGHLGHEPVEVGGAARIDQ